MCWGKLWDGYSCKNFVTIGLVVFKLYLNYLSFTPESPIHGPKISVFRAWLSKFSERLFTPSKGIYIIAWNDSFWALVCPDRTRYVVPMCLHRYLAKIWATLRVPSSPVRRRRKTSLAKGTPLVFSLQRRVTESILQCNPWVVASAQKGTFRRWK